MRTTVLRTGTNNIKNAKKMVERLEPQVWDVLEKVINTHGATKTAETLDCIKSMGYKYSTRAAMTVSISDMTVPPEKPELIAKAQETVDKITRNYKRGLMADTMMVSQVGGGGGVHFFHVRVPRAVQLYPGLPHGDGAIGV